MRKPRTKKQAIAQRIFLALRRRNSEDLREALKAAEQKKLDVSVCRDERGLCVINAIASQTSSEHVDGLLLRLVWPHRPAEPSVDEAGRDALANAVRAGAERLALSLVDYGSATRKDSWGRTPLMAAIGSDLPNAARKLLPRSDLSAKDNEGCGALHRAAQAGLSNLADAILSGLPRAEAFAQNHNGQDALEVALGARHWGVADCFAEIAHPDRLKEAFARMQRLRKVWDQSPPSMPRIAARLERDALREAMAAQPAANDAADGAPERGRAARL